MSALSARLRSILADLPSWRSLAAYVAVAGALVLSSAAALGVLVTLYAILTRALVWLHQTWPTFPTVLIGIGVVVCVLLPFVLVFGTAGWLVEVATAYLFDRARRDGVKERGQ